MKTVSSTAQVAYAPLFDNSSFSKTIDLTKPVGAIEASASVTANGGASYSIPVKCPPGTGGLVPNIAIEYNSQASNGLLGQGWDISGLSVISRIGQDLYHDAAVGPVSFSNNDAFLLDGTRLSVTSGTNGASGATYRTELESYAMTTSYGSTGGGPQYFRVVTKEGNIMEYGNTPDSRVMSDDNNVVMVWRLNKIQDASGNYVEFVYGNTDREYYISQIKYTGNTGAGQLPYNSINFTYLQRDDKNTYFNAGGYTVNTKNLLWQIQVQSEGSVYKTWQFDYGKNTSGLSFLRLVEEFAADGSKLNDTRFKYGNSVDALTVTETNIELPVHTPYPAPGYFYDYAESLNSGDFDGDGINEIYVQAIRTKLEERALEAPLSNISLTIYKSGGYGSSVFTSFPLTSYTMTHEMRTVPILGTYRNLLLSCDYNGDGKDDVFSVKINGADLDERSIYFSGSTSGGLSFSNTVVPAVTNPAPYTTGKRLTNGFDLQGDFDGDRAMDFINIVKDASGNKMGMISFPQKGWYNMFIADNTLAHTPSPSLTALLSDPDQTLVIDYDGDGRSDLFTYTKSTGVVKVYRLDRQAFGKYYPTQIGGYSSIFCDGFIPGDFNGDGKTDLLYTYGSSTATVGILYNKGNGFYADITGITYNTKCTNPGDADQLFVSDFNGDGKTDILVLKRDCANYLTHSYFNLYYARDLAHFNSQSFDFYDAPDNMVAPLLADVTGDGAVDFIYKPAGSRKLKVISFPEKLRNNLLEKITDGFNRTTEFTYEPMSKGTGSGVTDFYTRGAGETYPVNNLQPSVYVVTGMKAPDGIGGLQTMQYKYQNFRVHLNGRGGLGFEKQTTINVNTGLRTETFNQINRDCYVAYPLTVKTYLNSSSTLMRQSDRTLDFTRIGTGYCFTQQQSQAIEHDYMLGLTTTTDNTYDAYGNVTNSSSVTAGGPETLTNTTASTFTTTGIAYVPNKPSEVTTTVQRGAKPSFSMRTTYLYDLVGRVAEARNYPKSSGANYIKDVFTYDVYGNTTYTKKSTNTSAAANEPWTAFEYDSKGRFAINETNSLGDKKYTSMHKLWGQPSSVTGVNGLVTSYTYDNWGKRTSMTVPVSPSASYLVTLSDAWDISGNQLYYTLEQDPAGPDTKTWHDLLNRPVKVQKESFGGSWTTALTTYDTRGNPASSTNSYLPSETPVTTENTYDDRNRLSSSSNVFGMITHSYLESSGQTTRTTTLADGKVQKVVTDPIGKVLRSSNGIAGTVHYSYDSRGNEIESKVGSEGTPYFSLITRTYDDNGQLKTLTDPDAGTTSFEYNLFGELINQTDPKGKTTYWQYDIAGKPVQKILDGYVTTYSYYNKDKDYRLQQTIVNSSADGVVTDYYEYATGGGMTMHRKTLSVGMVQKDFTFDLYNRLLTTTFFNSGLKTRNYYDVNGFLLKITGNVSGTIEKTLYEATGMNGMGQIKSFRRADGLNASISYAHGFTTNFTTPGIQDLDMEFDESNGNLVGREDRIVPAREYFSYDAIDRLQTSSAERNGFAGPITWPMITMTYDSRIGFSLGQLSSKSDVGSYGYKTFPRNAVASITPGASTVISHETQDIVYNPFHKTRRINETIGGVPYEEQFVYDAGEDRALSRQLQGGTMVREKVYLGDFEIETHPGSPVRQLHYITGSAGLCGIVVKDGATFKYYSVYTDHLGSIVNVTDETGVSIAQQSYDAWGRERNSFTWGYDMTGTTAKPQWLSRGYTGHEMLPEYGLINMNGRMYDPANGRMLRPDNYVQQPGNTQSYNRYAYCVNNPLKYTDPDGNFFVGTLLTSIFDFWRSGLSGGFDITKGFKRMSQSWAEFDPSRPGSRTNNAFRIDWGRLQSDKDLNFMQRTWQVMSRFTLWEAPQTMFGNLVSHINNIGGNVEQVHYFHGATVLDVKHLSGAYGVTTGNYIRVREYEGINYDGAGNLTLYSSVLIHEYGHYLQSRAFGSYGYLIGALNSAGHPKEGDPGAWYERDASLRGIEYFRGKVKNIESFGAFDWGYNVPREHRNYGWMTGIATPFFWGLNSLLGW